MRRVREILETHDWASTPSGESGGVDDVEDELEGHLLEDGFDLEVNELEREMVGLRFAIENGGDDLGGIDGDDEIKVESMEALMLRMKAIKAKRKPTRHIDTQNDNQEPPVQRVKLGSRLQGLDDHDALTGDTKRIKHIESVVSKPHPSANAPPNKTNKQGQNIPQPSQPPGHTRAHNLQGKEPIPNTLGHAPGAQATQECIIAHLNRLRGSSHDTCAVTLFVEQEHHTPDEKQSARDLHRGRGDGGAHDAEQAMEDLQDGQSLGCCQERPEDVVEDGGNVLWGVGCEEVEAAEGAGCPEG
ncbi:unnamed protein product [Aspergillus oryzae]|nr:unnamed protein product [Aspergillus oryzae]GMF89332.1 unnamed protein product [Aspergillus oryzae]